MWFAPWLDGVSGDRACCSGAKVKIGDAKTSAANRLIRSSPLQAVRLAGSKVTRDGDTRDGSVAENSGSTPTWPVNQLAEGLGAALFKLHGLSCSANSGELCVRGNLIRRPAPD
jgi:hypothetical protein